MGVVAKRYLATYRHGGRACSLEITAEDHDDAQRRLRSIGLSGQVDGVIVANVATGHLALGPLALIAAAWCWVKNLGRA
ncbi:hypothetical protein SAMN06295912_1506 [Sphingomonas laterariae]|uniref:Uncharacterized protein n=1 Tax=Edaphosphingomonas laterariae TaxID=861865 RepID=A0A239KC94_9SPHN|nr:hypothetical protein [Sphingomonas laterariae]SNT15701.1 hypothetical protein SAMN06295912_1506 [Sphingomonas laterariae]